MSELTTYPMNNASPRRDSALPVSKVSLKKILWSSELNMSNPEFFPQVLIWEGHPLVAMVSEMTAFDNAGARLFQREKHPDSPTAINNGILYYEGRDTYLYAIDRKNEFVINKGDFSAAPNGDFHVRLMWPRDHDFIAASLSPYYEEVIPSVIARKTVYGERLSEWGEDYQGPCLLFPMAVPELNLVLLSVNQDVIVYDFEQQEQKARFMVSISKLVDWSSDPEGNLCIIGVEEEWLVVVGMDILGNEKWRWRGKSNDETWVLRQPPVQAKNGTVYVITEKYVIAIKNGKALWKFEPGTGEVRNGSSLADGSLLLCAGGTLFHVGTDGKVLESLSVGHELLSPPVVDAEGSVYVTTKNHLFKLGG